MIRLSKLFAIVIAGTCLLSTTVVLAAPQAEQIPGESNLDFLMIAVMVVWAGFFSYVFYLSRKTDDLRRQLESLKKRDNTDVERS